MLYIGTPVIYAWFAYTFKQRDLYMDLTGAPLPAISNMFEEWPLLSSFFTGLGATLMFLGAACMLVSRIPFDTAFFLRDRFVVLGSVAVSSIWLSISSAADRSLPRSMSWVHVGSTASFVIASLWSLYTVFQIFRHFCRQLLTRDSLLLMTDLRSRQKHVDDLQSIMAAIKWIRIFFVLASISGVLVVIAVAVQNTEETAMWVYPLLATSELATLEFCGLGCVLAVYSYWAMDLSLVRVQ